MNKGKCYICNKHDLVDTHHVIMQASGGKDGPTVDLCKTCHGKVHAQALNLESKAPNEMLFNYNEWERAKRIVDYIILSIRKNRDNPNFKDPYNMQLKLTKMDVYMLHVIKESLGYKSLSKFMVDAVRTIIRTKFPHY